ncbi:hypothetical protein LT336_00752 [Spiroplasma sp. JKS002671]|nr:hypothetical protein [Spiroplasma sp. JKS002671]MCL8211000.1 hypothetical protein [Spiroplasma sp. JKS002671]
MPVTVQQNLNNREVVVESNELIAFFKETKNPWSGKSFPIKPVKNSPVKFIVKKANDKVYEITDKSARIDVEYIDSETQTWVIEKPYAAGEKINELDLNADNDQDLVTTSTYEVANNLARQIAFDDTKTVSKYAEIVEIAVDDPINNLTSMLKGFDILFQRGNENNCKFYITNELYDKLVYLANNKGLITDNNIAQQLRLDGSKLFIKGIECVVVQDVYMTDDNQEKMPWVLLTPKALKRYVLQSATIYVEPVNDGKVPRQILIGGETMSELIPYMLKSETTSRWLLKGKYKVTEEKEKTKNLTNEIEDKQNNHSIADIMKLIKNSFSIFKKENQNQLDQIKSQITKLESKKTGTVKPKTAQKTSENETIQTSNENQVETVEQSTTISEAAKITENETKK